MGQYEWRNYRAATMMRGSLIPLIYQKSLLLDSSASSTFSPTAALTLVSTDIETITSGLVQVHETWSNLVEIGIAIYLLERQLGAACVMGVGFALGMSNAARRSAPATCSLSRLADFRTHISRHDRYRLPRQTDRHPPGGLDPSIPDPRERHLQGTWEYQVAQNLGPVRRCLLGNPQPARARTSHLDQVSFAPWCLADSLCVLTHTTRVPLCVITRFEAVYWLGASLANHGTAICTPILGPLLTFATFAGIALHSDSTLTIAKVFTSLSIIVLLNSPLAKIVTALPQIAGSVASFQRIQDHLNAEERKDTRVTPGHDVNGEDDADAQVPVTPSEHLTAERVNSAETARTKPESVATTVSESDVIASIHGKFSWHKEGSPAAQVGDEVDINGSNDAEQHNAVTPVIDISPRLDIPRRALTLILGPVGCGKSTLLKAFLGELSGFDGTIKTQYSGAVTYCDQNPWLPNETVRDIICGNPATDEQTSEKEKAADDDEWYHVVVRACELERDMQIWPRGDKTPVGSKGISMSGGQKQRLSIARAIYARRELLLLDDVFSGLDANTEDVVFDNLLGENGLTRKANMTVILVSSDGKFKVPGLILLIFSMSGSVLRKLTIILQSAVSRTPIELSSSTSTVNCGMQAVQPT